MSSKPKKNRSKGIDFHRSIEAEAPACFLAGELSAFTPGHPESQFASAEQVMARH
jgi:hypothetical protein